MFSHHFRHFRGDGNPDLFSSYPVHPVNPCEFSSCLHLASSTPIPIPSQTMAHQSRNNYSTFSHIIAISIAIIFIPTLTAQTQNQSPQPSSNNTPPNNIATDHIIPDPATDKSPDAALRYALTLLTNEARDFRTTGRLEILQPDFNTRYEFQLTQSDILKTILTTQNNADPAVDAYMRWQLLSFNPDLSEITDQQFHKFINQLPAFLTHPAASPTLQSNYEKLASEAARNTTTRNRLANKWESLRIQVRQFAVLTFPSIKFRDAACNPLPEQGPDRPLFLLYDLRDRIRAGLSTRAVKTRLTKELKTRRLDESITPDQRWQLIKQIEAMKNDKEKGKTKIIRDITITNTGPATIHYSTFSITTTDTKKWTAYLNRIEP